MIDTILLYGHFQWIYADLLVPGFDANLKVIQTTNYFSYFTCNNSLVKNLPCIIKYGSDRMYIDTNTFTVDLNQTIVLIFVVCPKGSHLKLIALPYDNNTLSPQV